MTLSLEPTTALVPDASLSTDPIPLEDEGTYLNAPGLQPFVFALFFIFGGITSLNDMLIPKLKELFTLSYFEAMLVQSAFFGAYLLVSLPAGGLQQCRSIHLRPGPAGLL